MLVKEHKVSIMQEEWALECWCSLQLSIAIISKRALFFKLTARSYGIPDHTFQRPSNHGGFEITMTCLPIVPKFPFLEKQNFDGI